MKKVIISVVALISLTAAGIYIQTAVIRYVVATTPTTTSQPPQAVVTKTDYSDRVFPIEVSRDDGKRIQGTAFTINDHYAFTAGHICDGALSMTMYTAKGEVPIKAVKNRETDVKIDVCVIKGDFAGLAKNRIAVTVMQFDPTKKAVIVGYPRGRYRVTFTTIKGFSLETLPQEYAGSYTLQGVVYITDGQCIPGNSGGPLYNEDGGLVIGITSFFGPGECFFFPVTEAVRLVGDKDVRWRAL